MSQIVVVEDDAKIAAALQFQLREQGWMPILFETGESALVHLEATDHRLPELLLLDIRLPGMSGVELVRHLMEIDRLPPTIVVSGEASISETVEALKLGVHDFIEKPFTKERLLRSIRNTLEHSQLRQRVAKLESELSGTTAMIGDTPAMKELEQLIRQAAASEARVLIRGESGTGKELVASALHEQSPRSGQPFIKINCAAIPTHLIEDELFGHAKGAFTDARSDKPGLFEEADGGTLFLDEIGDMELQLQSRLLRVLEDGQVRRLGDTKVRKVDVRVIAATNKDLEAAVESKRFREDLYFRLAHLPIEVPPLRDRRGDVTLLFEHFLETSWRRHKMRPRQVEAQVLDTLESYSWPGNVRELQSLCERLVVFGADPVTVDQLPERYRDQNFAAASSETDSVPSGPDEFLSLREFKARSQKQYIERVLHHTDWNVSAAARILGIQRTYLHQKMAALGCRRPSASTGPDSQP